MKVCLVNCPLGYDVEKTAADQPPMGLLYIARYAEENSEHSFEIIDPVADGHGVSETVRRVCSANCDAVGINVVSPLFKVAADFVREIKKSTRIPVIIGGPHATLLPQQTLTETNADIAVIGEGELTLLEVLNSIAGGSDDLTTIAGIAYRRGRRVRITKPREVIGDLDSLPYPHAVSPPAVNGSKERKAYVVSSRGCPHDCIFCSTPVICGRRWRHRSAENIVSEIATYKSRYGISEVHFLDDNFTAHAGRLETFCRSIAPLRIRWRALSRVGLSSEVLEAMRDSGCYRLSFGVESGSTDILKRIKKRISLDAAETTFQACHALGISAKVFFMVGFPFERIEHIARTINAAVDWTLRYHIDAVFNIVKPYPGSELSKFTSHVEGFRLIQPDRSLSEDEARLVKKYGDLPYPSINPFFSVRDLIGFVESAYASCASGRTVNTTSLLARRGIA